VHSRADPRDFYFYSGIRIAGSALLRGPRLLWWFVDMTNFEE
jgi:hypothetical protein